LRERVGQAAAHLFGFLVGGRALRIAAHGLDP
jgi:hypothetical protein